MSVQVRRRREAASFLSTYVGAQGELLVDTTNNRVQVHDGATAGGWPAAAIGDQPGRNMVINGTFSINQRAYASGTSLAVGTYAHDRWKAGSGGCTYAFAQSVPDTAITITAGSLTQVIDASNVYASSLWLTWTGTAPARIWQGSAGAFAAGMPMLIAGIPVNALLASGLTIGAATVVEFSAGTLGLVQLEAALPSAGPTRFGRRHIGEETTLCQRYFQRWQQPPLRGVNAGSTTIGRAGMPLITSMRVTPSAALNGTLSGYMGVAIVTVNTIQTGYCTPNVMEFDLTLASAAGSAGMAFEIIQSGAGSIDLSAEL